MKEIKIIYSILTLLFVLPLSFIHAQAFSKGAQDSLKSIVQNKKDLLASVEASILLGQEWPTIGLDSAKKYCNFALVNIPNLDASSSKLASLQYALAVSLVDVQISKAYNELQTSLSLARDNNDDSLVAANHLVLSIYFTRNPNIDSSNYYLTLAAKYFESIKDSASLAYVYFNFMNNYSDVNNLPKAIEFGEKTLVFAKAVHNEVLINYCKVALAFTCLKSKDKDIKSQTYINDAISFANASQNIGLLTDIYLAIGANHLNDDKFEDAIVSYKIAIAHSNETKDSLKLNTATYNLGKVYFSWQNFPVAAKYFKEALMLNKNTEETLKEIYLNLSMIYLVKDFAQSQLYRSKFDSISTYIGRKNSEELLVKYESFEKEKQIEDLKLKQLEQELSIQKSQNKSLILSIIISIIGLLLIIVTVFSRFRQRHLKQKVLIEKQEKEQQEFKLSQQEHELSLKIDAIKKHQNVINKLKEKFNGLQVNDEQINFILKTFNQSYVSEKEWDNIIQSFDLVKNGFVSDLKKSTPKISKNEIKLAILMSFDYSNAGMSEILNITVEGVKKAKQRLKKKGISF